MQFDSALMQEVLLCDIHSYWKGRVHTFAMPLDFLNIRKQAIRNEESLAFWSSEGAIREIDSIGPGSYSSLRNAMLVNNEDRS